MKIMVGREWKDGFPDYHRGPGEYRLEVLACRNLEKIEGLHFVRRKDPRLLWNYLREIGPTAVLRKVASRSHEKYRNEKYVSCGLGRVIESADESKFPLGQTVVFLAPCQPACAERVVLPEEMLLKVDPLAEIEAPSDHVLHLSVEADEVAPDRWWAPLTGWSGYSGRRLERERCAEILGRALSAVRQTPWEGARSLPVDRGPMAETKGRSGPAPTRRRPHTVLFGYGNYAKTIILPNVRPCLSVDCIHEIDPTQLPLKEDADKAWDTSPIPRDDENYDVWLVAGFHHTHGPLAVRAIEQGAWAVVEKPVVVDESQLEQLLAAMRTSQGRLFSCFHKRYLPFNRLALRDLGVNPGDPVSYHCIVFEVPLPELHWYRWPNSGSRLVSNGWHWLDHFLFLNGYADVEFFDIAAARDGTLNCTVGLKNGAFFTMALTDHGSARIGVQDHVELRAGDATVRIVNESAYTAERGNAVVRRLRVNKIDTYRTMYEDVCRRIAEGGEGDSAHSLEVSIRLVLALQERLVGKLSAGIL
ncbi:MAG: Gfo/Idh/MocA family oxidoreductase [Desulfobacteria bacterium]